MAMEKAHINGVELCYDLRGTGSPLVMIHGAQGDQTMFNNFAPPFTQNYRVLTFDQRGSGLSEKPHGDYSIAQLADDTAALMTHVGFDRADIIGVSMGGMIAQEFALRYPARMQTLALGCTMAGGRNAVPAPPESMAILTAPRNGLSDADLIRRAWPISYPASYLQSHRAELEAAIVRVLAHPTPAFAYKRQLAATFKFNTYDRLAQIAAPTLVITGADDALLPARNSEILAERIPGAKLRIIPNAGHMFFNQERETLARELVSLIQAHPMSPPGRGA